MSLVQAREILWNDIITIVKKIWEFLLIVEEKKIVRYLEGEIMASKQKLQQRAQFAKNMIDFLNSKYVHQLK